MASELISPATMALGISGFVGAKVFEPTLARAGEGMRDFLTEKVLRILGRAADKVPPGEVIDVEPSFLALFCQRAAFSSNEGDFAEAWANLMADAGRAFSNKHVAYVDILSQIGPVEASMLHGLVTEGARVPDFTRLSDWLRRKASSVASNHWPASQTAAAGLAIQISQMDKDRPFFIQSVEVPWRAGNADPYQSILNTPKRHGWDRLAADILIRQRLLTEIAFETDHLKPLQVRAYMVTALGWDFVQVCRGRRGT